jgi:hypothetical protein
MAPSSHSHLQHRHAFAPGLRALCEALQARLRPRGGQHHSFLYIYSGRKGAVSRQNCNSRRPSLAAQRQHSTPHVARWRLRAQHRIPGCYAAHACSALSAIPQNQHQLPCRPSRPGSASASSPGPAGTACSRVQPLGAPPWCTRQHKASAGVERPRSPPSFAALTGARVSAPAATSAHCPGPERSASTAWSACRSICSRSCSSHWRANSAIRQVGCYLGGAAPSTGRCRARLSLPAMPPQRVIVARYAQLLDILPS